jgi:hypothetical protein
MKRGKMDEPSEKIVDGQARREADLLRQMAEEEDLLRLKELGRQQAAQAELAEIDQRIRFDAFKKAKEVEAEEAKKRESDRSAGPNAQIENSDITSAGARYDAALGKFYSAKNPYESLADAAMEEWATFKAEQEKLRLEAAAEQHPQKRAEIEQRRQIEGFEYMAVTSGRLSGISAQLAGREDAPQAVLDREQAAAYQDQANQMRQERAQQQQEREKRGQEDAELGPKEVRHGTEKGDSAHEVTDAKAAKLARLEATNAAYDEHHSQSQERGGGRGGR